MISQVVQPHSPTLQQQQITLSFPSLNNNNNSNSIATQPAAVVSPIGRPPSAQGVKFRKNRQVTPKMTSRRNG